MKSLLLECGCKIPSFRLHKSGERMINCKHGETVIRATSRTVITYERVYKVKDEHTGIGKTVTKCLMEVDPIINRPEAVVGGDT